MLHLLAFDNPAPPNYGGAIDLYYKLKALKQANVPVVLHYFARKDRIAAAPEVTQWAEKVYAYPRQDGLAALCSPLPYLAASRQSRYLLQNLATPAAPVWFEGLHATAQWDEIAARFPHRRLLLRAHNVEVDYYRELAAAESRWTKKLYFQTEVVKLLRYEPRRVRQATAVFAISQTETQRFASLNPQTQWLPPFVDADAAPAAPIHIPAQGLLYHANFGVTENLNAALWLIKNLLPALPAGYELWLAGKNMPPEWRATPNLRCFDSPPDMKPILAAARLVLLPGKQKAGVKIKFLETVAAGKPCLASPEMVLGSGLEACTPILHAGQPLWPQIESVLNGSQNHLLAQQGRLFRQFYQPATLIQSIARYL